MKESTYTHARIVYSVHRCTSYILTYCISITYIYIYVHLYIDTYTFTCMYICIYIYIYDIYVCVCVCILVASCIFTNIIKGRQLDTDN